MKKLLYVLLFVPLALFGQETPCEQDVSNSTGMIGEFIPQCEEDGAYSPMQCWGSTGYCWCVDEYGIEIPGTSIPSWQGTPDCSNTQEECVASQIEGCGYIALWDPVCGCDGITYSNSGHAACNNILDFTIGECGITDDILGCTDELALNYNSQATIDDSSCLYNNNDGCGNIIITISYGWSMIGFACVDNIDASVAFEPIQDKIIIVKDGVGNAYLPDWDFNGIGDLDRGYGYLIKVNEEIINYNICE